MLIFSLAFQAVLPARAETAAPAAPASAPTALPSVPTAGSGSGLDMDGPTLSEFRTAFSGQTLLRSDADGFQRFVAAHPGQGRLLTGPELRLAMAGGARTGAVRIDTAKTDTAIADTAAARTLRDSLARRAARLDSLRRDSLAAYEAADNTYSDEDHAQSKGWFTNLFLDWNDRHHGSGSGGGGGGGSGSDWAAVIYVVVGVVVVGAFIIYGVATLMELGLHQDYPLFQELGARFSYSGQKFSDPQSGPDLFRDSYLTGIRYAIGFDRPGMGLGFSLEGGYVDVKLRGIADPARSFEFGGGYLVAGPLLRFGGNDPFSFTLEFLNGASTHASVGWISKSRMTLQGKVGDHLLLGAHLGAVFYDLHFLDGLGWRNGDFNRDLSMIYGLDAGWDF